MEQQHIDLRHQTIGIEPNLCFKVSIRKGMAAFPKPSRFRWGKKSFNKRLEAVKLFCSLIGNTAGQGSGSVGI
jgi:hypothetical protein